jgi:hypothetical protein
MPTVYIKQLKHYTQGGIRGSGEGNYTVKCVHYHLKNMSLINLLTMHTHFKYVLTNFVTLRKFGLGRFTVMTWKLFISILHIYFDMQVSFGNHDPL